MSFCRWCGAEVSWRERIPYEGEIDHRSRCLGIDKQARRKYADADHEKAVLAFLHQATRGGNKEPRSR